MALDPWTIGFGTAALGDSCFSAVTWALEHGFRKFDTAEENEYWYDATCVGSALRSFFQQLQQTQDCANDAICVESWPPNIFIDTKIPP
jgi:diketogulonate reductase-like aldo/keto reductase